MTAMAYQVTDKISIGFGVGEVVAAVTTIAAAQQYGSALWTRFTHQPLQELIHALNNNMDIAPRRYHGRHIYDEENGRYMTMQGEIQAIAMGKVVSSEGEAPTQLSTVIVCLSVAVGKDKLSSVLATAIMLYAHGTIDRSMEGTARILQGKIDKYAISSLGRDSMTGKLEGVKLAASRLVLQSTGSKLSADSLFLPPRSPQEEGDFVEFLAQLWSAQADGVQIFTRSIKLLGLALLLSEYGWQIDVFVEDEDGDSVPLKTDTGALTVTYSLANTADARNRQYVENHPRYSKSLLSTRAFYPTASSTAAHMGEVSGLSLAHTPSCRNNFERGYSIASNSCNRSFNFDLSIDTQGRILMAVQPQDSGRPGESPIKFTHERSCRQLLQRFFPQAMPEAVWNLAISALCGSNDSYDWGVLDDEAGKQKYPHASFTALLGWYEGNSDNLWVICGVVLGVMDKIIRQLINLPDESAVRTPAGEALSSFVSSSAPFLNDLLTTGLQPGLAVQFCATRLSGADPKNLRVASGTNPQGIIGHWNGQQGILLTPIFERSLYCDLPADKSRPLTLFNLPIEGMPTDDGGWIKPGTVEGASLVRIKRSPITEEPRQCHVVMEYRPQFETDSSSVVAVVYIDGVFCNLLPLTNTLSQYWYIESRCACIHTDTPDSNAQVPPLAYISLDSFQCGDVEIPDDNDVLVVSPQPSHASRLFSAIMYRSSRPIIQHGCLGCALILLKKTPGSVVIPRVKGP